MKTKQITKNKEDNQYLFKLKNSKKHIDITVDFTPAKALSI